MDMAEGQKGGRAERGEEAEETEEAEKGVRAEKAERQKGGRAEEAEGLKGGLRRHPILYIQINLFCLNRKRSLISFSPPHDSRLTSHLSRLTSHDLPLTPTPMPLTVSSSHCLTVLLSHSLSNLAWKNRRYFGSWTILSPLILSLLTYTFSTDSAMTSMCAWVYTLRGIVSRTSSSFG
jgi:hypothetical protein